MWKINIILWHLTETQNLFVWLHAAFNGNSWICDTGEKGTTKLESTFGERVREKERKRKNMETICKGEQWKQWGCKWHSLKPSATESWVTEYASTDEMQIWTKQYSSEVNKRYYQEVMGVESPCLPREYGWLYTVVFFVVTCSLHFPTSLFICWT